VLLFKAALCKNEAVADFAGFTALSNSTELAVRVLIHSKSILEKVRGDARLFCISGWPYEATIANSTQATDRNSGRVTVLNRARQAHDAFFKTPSRSRFPR
jgi:hypothetical protein